MDIEDSSSFDLSSSCTDDDDEDDDYDENLVESIKCRKYRKCDNNLVSKRNRPKRDSRKSPRFTLSLSENKKKPHLRSQKEARTLPTSPSPVAKTAVFRKSPRSCSKSIRKRRLPRPSYSYDNLSDTTSSSSSDDSLLFRNSPTLTSTMISTKKKSVAVNSSNNKSDIKGVGTSDNEKSCSSPGININNRNPGKHRDMNSAIDNIQSNGETNVNGDCSDSDDTAELLRQLTKTSSPRKKFDAESSFSRQLPGYSSSFPKPEPLPSRNHNGDATNTEQPSAGAVDRDNNDADDESSLNDDYNDDTVKSMTRQEKQLASNPGSKTPSESLPEDICIKAAANLFSNIQDNQFRLETLKDRTSNGTIQFELPTQSSSSEESSVVAEEENSSDDEDVEERGNIIIMNQSNNSTDGCHSLGERVLAGDLENNSGVHGKEKQQESDPYQADHRRQRGHKLEQITTQTDRELFESAYDHRNNSNDGNTANSIVEDCRSDHRSHQRQDLAAQRPRDSVTQACHNRVSSEVGHRKQPLPLASQQQQQHYHNHHQGEQPCIDLVDSDDSEPKEQIQYAHSDTFRENRNRFQEHCHAGAEQVFENDESTRSPTSRRSPKFNIAARNFIYNKPWSITNDRSRQTEEDDDVIQFEDYDNRVQARSRRVTQDHANHNFQHNNNCGDSNGYEQSSASNSFQHSSSWNPSHLEPPSEHQEHQRPQQTSHLISSVGSIPRPWPPVPPRTTRRMRDPTASNTSLAASVVVKNTTRGGRKTSNLTSHSTTGRSNQEHRSNDGNDIRMFMSRRPSLANETRNREQTIESVRANRHDIQGHTDVTVINHLPSSVATGRRSRPRRLAQGGEKEDAIEVFDDEEEALPVKQPSRRSATVAKATKPKTKTKRKRTTYTRKTKSRKTGGRKRTRKATGKSGGRGRGRGGAGGRFGRRGGTNTTGGNDDSGAWGPTGGGWASARPIHREDPAFQNVGAEITF